MVNRRVNLNLERDEQRLSQRAYGIKRRQVLLKRYYDFLGNPDYTAFHPRLYILKEWLICPRSLPTLDVTGLARFFGKIVEKKEPIDPAMELLLDLMDDVPSEHCQSVIGQHEHNMLTGQYDSLINDSAKFDAQLTRLLADPEYHRHYKRIDDLFDLKSREGFNGLIVHDFAHEHSNTPDDFDWSDDNARFSRVFTAFCRRFDLHGLEFGKPLLMKVKVQTTPFGIIVKYPKWMSMDIWRDLEHGEIMKLHKAYGADRQGAKLSTGQIEREELASRIVDADEAAKEDGLKGDERWDSIREEVRLGSSMSVRRIQELLAFGKKLRAGEITEKPDKPIPPAESEDEPNRHVKMARAKANFLALGPEAREEFQKWMEENSL